MEEEFLRKQEKTFKKVTEGSFGDEKMFMSTTGACWRCNKNIISKEIEKGNDGSKLVTGCPLCNISYCN